MLDFRLVWSVDANVGWLLHSHMTRFFVSSPWDGRKTIRADKARFLGGTKLQEKWVIALHTLPAKLQGKIDFSLHKVYKPR